MPLILFVYNAETGAEVYKDRADFLSRFDRDYRDESPSDPYEADLAFAATHSIANPGRQFPLGDGDVLVTLEVPA